MFRLQSSPSSLSSPSVSPQCFLYRSCSFFMVIRGCCSGRCFAFSFGGCCVEVHTEMTSSTTWLALRRHIFADICASLRQLSALKKRLSSESSMMNSVGMHHMFLRIFKRSSLLRSPFALRRAMLPNIAMRTSSGEMHVNSVCSKSSPVRIAIVCMGHV